MRQAAKQERNRDLAHQILAQEPPLVHREDDRHEREEDGIHRRSNPNRARDAEGKSRRQDREERTVE